MVDDVPQVVHQAGQCAGCDGIQVVPCAHPGEGTIGDVRFLHVQKRIARLSPVAVERHAHLLEAPGCVRHHFFQRCDSHFLSGIGIVDQAVDLVEADDHGSEVPQEDRLVDAGNTLAGFTVGRDDEDAGVVAHPQADEFEPVLYLALLDALSRFPDDQVHRAAAEEELMGDPIHFLPAEIPGIKFDLDAVLLGMRQTERLNVDAHPVRGLFVRPGLRAPSWP